MDLNFIDNNYKGLRHFYRQLELLEAGEVRVVNVVHIGDSHIQADWFSGKVRMELQRRFGSAGRGLVFPYRLAHTNGPEDVFSQSNTEWKTRRAVRSYPSLPVGLCGMTIQTHSPNFRLSLALGDNSFGIDYRFNRVTFLTETGPRNFDLQLSLQKQRIPSSIPAQTLSSPRIHEVSKGETLIGIAKKYRLSTEALKSLNQLVGSTIYVGQELVVSKATQTRPIRTSKILGDELTVSLSDKGAHSISTAIDLPSLTDRIYVQGLQRVHAQQQTTLYGMVLENADQAGVLYHMIGVNGAKFSHYNQAPQFTRQITTLQPDLVIISLGTNETSSEGFNRRNFYAELDRLVHSLEQELPYADILITTPPDGLRGQRHDNPRVEQAKDVLLSYALNNDLACWNFYEIMGGMGAIREWHQAGLAQGDRLHLTQAGYQLQGWLLFDALTNGYATYQSIRSRQP